MSVETPGRVQVLAKPSEHGEPSRTGLGRYVSELGSHVDGEVISPPKHTVTIGGKEFGGLLSMWLSPRIHEFDGAVVHAANPNTVSRQVDVVTVQDFVARTRGFGDRHFWASCERTIRRHVPHVITATEHVAAQARILLDPDHVHVIPFGVDTDLFTPDPTEVPDAGGPRVLLVGKYYPRKQFTSIAQRPILRRILERVPELHVHHVGPTDDLGGGPGALWEADRIVPDFHFHEHGYVTQEELVEQYRAADLLYFPSREEGFGFPPLEAAACGTPSLTTPHPVFWETVGDARHILPSTTPSPMWGDAIGRVIQMVREPTSAIPEKTLVHQARNFLWEDCARDHEDVYLEAVET